MEKFGPLLSASLARSLRGATRTSVVFPKLNSTFRQAKFSSSTSGDHNADGECTQLGKSYRNSRVPRPRRSANNLDQQYPRARRRAEEREDAARYQPIHSAGITKHQQKS